MNWGHKIIIVYILFISGIILLVVKSSSQNQDLVTTDYYEQELLYQQRIDETGRAHALSAPVHHETRGKNIIIYFPDEMKGLAISARVLLYNIADKRRDVQKDLSTTDGILQFEVPTENKGVHDIKINWSADGTSYYSQFKTFIK